MGKKCITLPIQFKNICFWSFIITLIYSNFVIRFILAIKLMLLNRGVSLWLIRSAGVWAGVWFHGSTSRHYCADSGSKHISTVQTIAPNDVIISRWQRPYWDPLASLFYSEIKWRRVVHLFFCPSFFSSLHYTKMPKSTSAINIWKLIWGSFIF